MPDLVEPPQGLELPGYEFLGRGPGLTGSAGWARAADLAYRCAKCCDVMPADHDDYYDCGCGTMALDYDAGRFGSRLGDLNILVYRKLPERG